MPEPWGQIDTEITHTYDPMLIRVAPDGTVGVVVEVMVNADDVIEVNIYDGQDGAADMLDSFRYTLDRVDDTEEQD